MEQALLLAGKHFSIHHFSGKIVLKRGRLYG